MKNFLKSTAIFACFALLFSACSEDTTEDLPIPQVDASTISAIVAGDGRAILKWDVPDDENITQCYVRFTNEVEASSEDADDGVEGNIDEIRYIDVIPGYPAQYEFTDLPAATYYATIHNLGEGRTLVDAQGVNDSKYIYTIDSYTKRPTVLRVISTNNGVTITWSGIPDDCRGVYVTYTDNLDATVTSALLDNVCVGAATPTSYFADMQSGTTFNYTTAFKPEDGLDTVYLEPSSTSTSVQESVAKDPTDVKAYTGYKYTATNSAGTPTVELEEQYLQVKWTVPSNDSIVYSVVTYSLLNEETGKVIQTDYLKFGGAEEEDIDEDSGVYAYGEISGYGEYDVLKESNVNIRYIKCRSNGSGGIDENTQLPAGLYSVTVYNEKAGGLKSSEVAIETASVYVYEHESFWTPDILEIVNDKGNVSISWTNIPEDYTKATLTYDNTSGSTTDYVFYDFSSDLLFEGGKMAMLTDISLVTVFQPENFLDEIIHSDIIGVVPQYAPSVPTDILARPGYDAGGSYIQVAFKLSSSADSDETLANQASVYYTDSEGNLYSERFTSVSTGNTENVVKVYGNVSANEVYTVTVAAENLDSASGSISASARTASAYYDSMANSLTAYGPASYSLPSVSSVGLTGTTAYLYWEEDYADFYSVTVNYGETGTGSSVTKSLSDGYTLADPTELTNAVSGWLYSYSASFMPEDGLDPISYSSSGDLYIYQTPDAPTSVSAYPGDSRIQISYALTSDAEGLIDKVAITYSDGKTETTEYVTNFYLGSTNVYSITGLTAGTSYTVKVATVREEQVDVFSAYVSASSSVEVYDLAAFTETCTATPTLYSYSFDSSTYNVTLTWTGVSVNDHPDLSRIDFTYADDATDLTSTSTASISSISEATILSGVMPGNEYSYYAIYKPSINALDEVKVGPITATFDEIEFASNAYNKMWYEFSSNYNGDNSSNNLFYAYTNTYKGTLYYPKFDTWTPNYLTETSAYYDTTVTATALAKIPFPGDYIPCDNYTTTSYWRGYKLFDGGVNLRYATGTATYEWQPHTYYTEDTTDGEYKIKAVANGGITIDLSGAATSDSEEYAYKLSTMKIYRWAAATAAASYETSNNIKTFSLYGTNDPDPASNSKLTAVNADGTPDMSNWTLILENAECARPTEAFYDTTSPYYQRYDYLDANEDGVINDDDDWDSTNKTCMFSIGWEFDIPEDTPPVRYVRLILHTNVQESETPSFIINDVQFTHKGYTTKTVSVY